MILYHKAAHLYVVFCFVNTKSVFVILRKRVLSQPSIIVFVIIVPIELLVVLSQVIEDIFAIPLELFWQFLLLDPFGKSETLVRT